MSAAKDPDAKWTKYRATMAAKAQAKLVTAPCTCEHAAHFPDTRKMTPNGNHGHDYGVRFATRFLAPVVTSQGTITVCRDCASDCHAEVR